jgi:hypothetical protein
MALAMFSEPPTFEVPHPPLDISILLIVEDAIRAAWQILRDRPPVDLKLFTDVEEVINHHLRETLQDHVWNRGIVAGFDPQLVACITSAEEVRNYSGKELKKRPDMLVKLVGLPANARPSQYGVFIECKPVDAAHSLTSQYCDRGISRFVVGRYAWAMQEALMVGYTLAAETPVTSLTPVLKKRSKTTLPVSDPAVCQDSALSNTSPTAVTRHRRNFRYVETNVAAPIITLRHIWLNRSS